MAAAAPEPSQSLDLDRTREIFEASRDFTIGLEEEFALVDPASLELVHRFEELYGACLEDELLAESAAGELIDTEIEIRSGRALTFADAVDRQMERRVRLFGLANRLEIALAANDLLLSRLASDELKEIASAFMAPFLLAQASHAEGSVLLAEGKPREALAPLRQAGATFAQLDAPYDAARTRVFIGAACLELGDRDGADIEWLAARHAFERLGASPELDRLT